MARNNAHILAIPYPLQGHMNPMVQLCNRLSSSKGIRITFVTTVTVSKALETKTNNLTNVETVPDFTIDEAGGLDVFEINIRSFRAAITSGLSNIIDKHKSNGSSPVKAILYDSIIPWVMDIANEKGLKGAVLFTQSCAVSSIFYHTHKGSLEISADDGASVSLPGMPVMGLNDLPSMVYDRGSYPSLSRLLLEQFSTFEKADWRLFNTFDKLEDEILKWMETKISIRTIGPTIPSMFIDKRIQGNTDYGLSLFKPKVDSWSEWLDKKHNQSVIYVSFGSLADLSEKQMEEIACGLIDTKCSFLWVVRDCEQNKLPRDLSDQNGLIVNWCSQLEILSHRAVGCFVSHGGWNSTLEALCLGVPIVVMPQWTDQTTNAKFIGDVWRIGIPCKKNQDGIVSREEIKDCVNKVMKGEREVEIRRNSMKWKALAVEAVSEGGSSDKNIAEFAMELING